MAMTRPNLYGIINLLDKEMDYHATKTSCKGECAEKKHKPYLEYCIKEIALYTDTTAVLKEEKQT